MSDSVTKESNLEVEALRAALEEERRARHEAERHAETSDERLAMALEGASEGLWDWTVPTNEIYFSPQWKAMLGYGDDELVNEFATWERLVLPEDVEGARQAIQAHLDGSSDIYQAEFRMRHADGSIRHVLARGRVLRRNEKGEALRFVGTHVDITELRAQEERLRVFMGLTSDLVTQVDDRGILLFVNAAAERFLGLPASECVGRLAFDFVHPDDAATTAETFGSWLAEGVEQASFENRQVSVDGKVTDMAWTVDLRYDGAGKLIDVWSVARDVTARNEQARLLEQRALDLERSNRDLEQFAYVASHDLQEPLRMVASYTQLLARRYGEQLDATGLEFIDYAVDGARRMKRLIEDLLSFSRVGSRGMPLEDTSADLALDRALVDLQSSIADTGALIERAPLPRVWADPGQLARLFRNLIGNGIKFSGDAGPPKISISVEEERDHWLFCVRDEGIGMEPEYFERVFIIFQRLHGKDVAGTGIGLAVCKRIVERHGGRIWVESAPGEGCRFFFSLKKGSSD